MRIKPTPNGKPLKIIAHPLMSTISLQDLAEYFMPNASNEKIWEFIKEIQRRHLEALKEKE